MLEKFLLSRWSYFLIFLLWAVFVFCLYGCSTVRHVQKEETKTDSTAVQKKDSTSVSASRSEERYTDENIKEWVFDALHNAPSQPGATPSVLPIVYREINRSSGEKIAEQKDSTHVSYIDSVARRQLEELLNKQSQTKVFSNWWLVAIGIAVLLAGFLFGRVKFTLQ